MLFKPDFNVGPRTILVYRTARLGDFIVAVPALAVLRKCFPSARIVLLTTSSTMQNMQAATATYTGDSSSLPWLSLVVPSLIDQAVVLSMQNWREGLDQARLCIRDLRPDMTFILPFSGEDGVNIAKKVIFLRLAGVRDPLYGWHVHSTLRFMREVQYQAGMFEHQVRGPLRAVKECSLIPAVEEKNISFPLMIDAAAEIWVQEIWDNQGWHGKQVLVVFPGGTFPHKRWPVEKYSELCQMLQARHDFRFVLLGADTDRDVCKKLYEALGKEMCLDMTGQTSLMQLAAIFKRCTMFVGNDSGPAHLASAVGCPCVTLFSSIEFPGFWEPWNSRNAAIRHSVPCENCFSYTGCPTGTMICIREISVDQVIGCVRSVCYSESTKLMV